MESLDTYTMLLTILISHISFIKYLTLVKQKILENRYCAGIMKKRLAYKKNFLWYMLFLGGGVSFFDVSQVVAAHAQALAPSDNIWTETNACPTFFVNATQVDDIDQLQAQCNVDVCAKWLEENPIYKRPHCFDRLSFFWMRCVHSVCGQAVKNGTIVKRVTHLIKRCKENICWAFGFKKPDIVCTKKTPEALCNTPYYYGGVSQPCFSIAEMWNTQETDSLQQCFYAAFCRPRARKTCKAHEGRSALMNYFKPLCDSALCPGRYVPIAQTSRASLITSMCRLKHCPEMSLGT